jgi:hypothetical protein
MIVPYDCLFKFILAHSIDIKLLSLSLTKAIFEIPYPIKTANADCWFGTTDNGGNVTKRLTGQQLL